MVFGIYQHKMVNGFVKIHLNNYFLIYYMNDNILYILGIIGSIGIAFSLFPQTYKVIKTSEIKSLSFIFIIITFTSSILQLIYGIYNQIIPMIITNSCVFLNSIILLFYFLIKKDDLSTIKIMEVN